MKMAARAIWVLYKSFFDTVPGQRGLLAIGLLLVVLGYFQQGIDQAHASILAGTAFFVGFPLLFAGPHFRQLASLKRHRLLPDFRKYLIISYFLLLISLSALTGLSLLLLEQQQFILFDNFSFAAKILLICCFIFMTSLFGFLPRRFRYGFALVIFLVVANRQKFGEFPHELLLLASLGVSIWGVICFLTIYGRGSKPVLYTKEAVSLSKYLPGLQGGFHESGVTAAGSILLGMSDGNRSRFIRAFFTAFLLPVILGAVLVFTMPVEQLLQNPQFILMGFMTAVMLQIHFVFVVSARRRFIWLRVGGGQREIKQEAQKVLAKERWTMLFCVGCWCIPAVMFYPAAAPWLLGISALLWLMMLVLEIGILTLQHPLSRRAEFYFLLVFIGWAMAFIALAKVHGKASILWWGVAFMLALYGLGLLVSNRILASVRN